MTRAVWLAVLLACGGNETAEGPSEGEGESETASEMRAHSGSEADEAGDVEEARPRPNRAAGPARAGFEVVPQRMHRQFVNAIDIFGRHAAAGTFRGVVTIFDVPSGHVRAARRLFFGPVVSTEASSDRKRIFALGSSSGEDAEPTDAVVWDLELDRVWRVPDHGYGVHRALSPSGQHVATVAEDGDEFVVHLDTVWGGTRRRRVAGAEPTNAFFAHNGRALYVVTESHVHRLGMPGLRPVGEPWSLTDGGVTYPHPTEDLLAVKFGRAIEVRALADGEVKHSLEAGRPIEHAEWSVDGKRIVTCSRQEARVFGGDDFADVTTITHGSRRCYNLGFDLQAETPASILVQNGKLTYTPADDDAEPLELEPPHTERVLAFPERGGWFLYGSDTDVYIANLTRRRARRLVRGGSGEHSAWSVSGGGDSITLRGRGWSHTFGEEEASESVEDPSEPLEFPRLEGGDLGVEPIGSSEDGRHRIMVEDPTGASLLYLLNAGAARPITLRQPANGLGVQCYMDYDDETGEEGYGCDLNLAFAADGSSFIIGGSEGTASYDLSGRRLGTAPPVTWVRYTPDGSVLALFRNGALSILGTNLRRTGVVLRAREGMQSYSRFNEDGTILAAVRGAALVIYDVAANARKHLVTLPSRSTTTPAFTDDGMVQVQLADAFAWYQIEDGTEARRVELDDIRGIDDTRTHAVYCEDDRLRHRALNDDGEEKDLGPCPHDARELAFDDERVWWVAGSRGHVVRLSDAEHLVVGVYGSRRPVLYAFTPRGHLWVNRPDALSAFRVRMPGPVLDAAAPTPEPSWIRESLVADFLADRDLGEAPQHPLDASD